MSEEQIDIEILAVSVPQAAEMLGISRNGAYALAKGGILPTVRFGKRLLVPVRRLKSLLEKLDIEQPCDLKKAS